MDSSIITLLYFHCSGFANTGETINVFLLGFRARSSRVFEHVLAHALAGRARVSRTDRAWLSRQPQSQKL